MKNAMQIYEQRTNLLERPAQVGEELGEFPALGEQTLAFDNEFLNPIGRELPRHREASPQLFDVFGPQPPI